MSKSRSLFRLMGVLSLLLVLSFVLAACAKPATEAPPEEPVLIAFAHCGPVSDEGWTWSHDQGMKAVEAAFGDRITTAYVENVYYGEDASRTFEQFVADGAKMVILTSEYADYAYKVADAHPEVAFLECNGPSPSDNIISYYVDHWDPSYLIGVAAGLMTETNQLGYVGSFPYPATYTSVNAFHLGALSVNPDVVTNVVMINSWFDPSAARLAGEALVDGGADFLFGIMDEAAYLEVAQERGVWAAMWNTDMRRFGPDAYVSSIMLYWGDLYVAEVQALLDGTWEGNRQILMPIGVGTDRDAWGQNVPQEVIDQVDAIRDQMLDESLNVFVGPIYDAEGTLRFAEGEELTDQFLYKGWDWAVEGVIVED